MKLSKDKLDVLANNVYKKIEKLPEWEATIEKAKERARKYAALFKLTQEYSNIKKVLEMVDVEGVSVRLYKMIKVLFNVESYDKFPTTLYSNKDLDEQMYDYVYDTIKPNKISTREIKEKIVLDSIKINKEETVDEFVTRIAKSFFNS
jgi:hypothetical protein